MKFLCVPCDTPMKLRTLGPPDGGSLSVVYSCPECGYEMAMLTNPYETQLVQSLGVRIGPSRDSSTELSAGPPAGVDGSSAADESQGKCPFAAMMPATEAARQTVARTTEDPGPVQWTAGAEARLANIPAFVHPMARTGIERFAKERGAAEVDEKILDEAREFFGM